MDRAILEAFLARGGSRLAFVSAFKRRLDPLTQKEEPIGALLLEPSSHSLSPALARYFVEDNAGFVTFLFQKLCDRAPSPAERLRFEFDLKRAAVDRHQAILQVAALARAEGKPVVIDESFRATHASDELQRLPGFSIDSNGAQEFVLCRVDASSNFWFVPSMHIRQKLEMHEGRWLVAPGWILAGPKQTFEPGEWRLDVDLLQSMEAHLVIDIVANAGLDQLGYYCFQGPCAASLRLVVSSLHHFLEVRVYKPENSGPGWLNLRNLSIAVTARGKHRLPTVYFQVARSFRGAFLAERYAAHSTIGYLSPMEFERRAGFA